MQSLMCCTYLEPLLLQVEAMMTSQGFQVGVVFPQCFTNELTTLDVITSPLNPEPLACPFYRTKEGFDGLTLGLVSDSYVHKQLGSSFYSHLSLGKPQFSSLFVLHHLRWKAEPLFQDLHGQTLFQMQDGVTEEAGRLWLSDCSPA